MRSHWFRLPDRNDDYDALVPLLVNLARECEVESMGIRIPNIGFRSPLADRVRDGLVVDMAEAAELARLQLEDVVEPFDCLLVSDRLTVRMLGRGFHAWGPEACPRTIAMADESGVEVFRGGTLEEEEGTHVVADGEVFDSSAQAELRALARGPRSTLLLEQFADGDGGLRAYLPDSERTVDDLIRHVTPRSIVTVIEDPRLEGFTTVDKDQLAELERWPDAADIARDFVVVHPPRVGTPWRDVESGGNWWDVDDDVVDPKVSSGLLFMPAMLWYEQPPPRRYVVPDDDGIVRSWFRSR